MAKINLIFYFIILISGLKIVANDTIIFNKNNIVLNNPNFKIKKIINCDNGIIFCGQNDNKLELIKYNSNKTINTEFGINGKVSVIAFETKTIRINDFCLKKSIFISTIAYEENDKTKIIIYKINLQGQLEFLSIIPFKNVIKTFDLKLNENNKIEFGVISKDTISFVQLNEDGTMNTKFGSNGIVVSLNLRDTALSNLNVSKLKFAIQTNKKIVIGYSIQNTFNLFRIHENGKLDDTFETNACKNCLLKNILLQRTGKIIVIVKKSNNSTTLIRLNHNGEIDEGFGANFKLDNLSEKSENLTFQIQPNNKICSIVETNDQYIIKTFNTNFISLTNELKNGYLIKKYNKYIQGITEPNSKIKIKLDNKIYLTTSNYLGKWSIPIIDFKDGLHEIKIHSIDIFNNESSQLYKFKTKFSLPILKIENIFEKHVLYNPLKIFWITGESNANLDVNIYQLINKKEVNVYSKKVKLTNTKSSFNISHLGNGKYILKATETDIRENSINKEIHFSIATKKRNYDQID